MLCKQYLISRLCDGCLDAVSEKRTNKKQTKQIENKNKKER